MTAPAPRAPKTIERYHEQAACLNPELLAMPLADITPLHLNREWNRLLESGWRTRREKTPRPLSAKSVRSIAGVVSSAFLRTVKWGLIGVNPVTNNEPPVPKKHTGMALLPAEQMQLIHSAPPGPGAYRCSWSFRLPLAPDVGKCSRFDGRISLAATCDCAIAYADSRRRWSSRAPRRRDLDT